MKKRAVFLGLGVALTLSLLSACGSEEEGGGGINAGSGGTGASGTGGSTATGGSSGAATGGTGGGAAGMGTGGGSAGVSTGGAAGSTEGGSGAAGASGSSGAPPVDGSAGGSGTCPPMQPNNNSMCTSPGLFCPFGANQCNCFGGNWDCDQCPMMQ